MDRISEKESFLKIIRASYSTEVSADLLLNYCRMILYLILRSVTFLWPGRFLSVGRLDGWLVGRSVCHNFIRTGSYTSKLRSLHLFHVIFPVRFHMTTFTRYENLEILFDSTLQVKFFLHHKPDRTVTSWACLAVMILLLILSWKLVFLLNSRFSQL